MESYQELINLFPDLFKELRWGFECGIGWYELIKELSSKIDAINKKEGLDCWVSQVKEKYGGLRFYMSTETDQMSSIIEEYEQKSLEVCESCGKPGKLNNGSWYIVRCSECSY